MQAAKTAEKQFRQQKSRIRDNCLDRPNEFDFQNRKAQFSFARRLAPLEAGAKDNCAIRARPRPDGGRTLQRIRSDLKQTRSTGQNLRNSDDFSRKSGDQHPLRPEAKSSGALDLAASGDVWIRLVS